MKSEKMVPTRRTFIKLFGFAVTGVCIFRTAAAQAAEKIERWWRPTPGMDALTAIRTRRSVRSYTNETVSDIDIREILGAAMSAPSAGNEQTWEFVIIRDKETLKKIGKINKYARYARTAPLSILVCGNLNYDKYGGYWIEDVSAATQNMLLAAHALKLGAVWTGIYPQEDRIRGFRELAGLPEHIVPMALVVIGHPAKQPRPVDRYKKERIHNEKWL